ncbi:extracellular signal-regulated kinase 7 [Drosophila nasuta]|uniref:extracellular signal-regulated kinase 7 n=1 Tax=Drosophila nasuta TaxID=42062 RepID=UPI00295E4E89|nr:extracellular signal-regulated kinase 7 [Drosophila nasuta]XP_060663269.1 extracellular signal-regulated kinase 7 [Drosophila nasuta]XP_060663270.1 extracellular signal-regulated kinase 7 [Drosophila nasuta]
MAERQANAQERRIHELDQNVERYFEVRKRLGKGAYGIVWKATDKRKKDTVALKKIYDAFRDETDAQRTYREVVFLRAFRHHPNIIRMLDIFKAANNLDFYLVFEFMDSDLHNVIKKGDVLKDIHKRFVMYQLINAIKYMHSGNVIHRDLKPSNILIDSKCRLKVADFGLARTLCPKRRNNSAYDSKDELENEAMLTDYVATRWYRAPEILVASRKYTKGIDMWSLGCILGEMIRQKPLFQGTSTINQIEKIVNALPDVTDRDIESIGSSFGSVLLSKKIVRDRRYSLDEMLRNCCDDAMSLVKSLLVLDPDGRLTAKEAIGHSYVHRFRTASANMDMRTDIKPPLDDDVRYGINDYRTTLYEMIAPEIRSSARHKEAASQVATPTSASDLITTRPMRSISKSKQTGSNLNDASSSVFTKSWVEDQRKQQQQQQHRDKRAPQSSENNQQQQPQQQSQQQPQQPQPQQQQPHQATRPGSCFNAEAGSGALRRELAAVVATAPRTVSGGLWQSTVVAAQPKLQPSPGQQQQQQRRWNEPVPVPGPLPMPVTAPEVDTTAATTQLRTRVRKLRKDCKERRQTKPKEEQQQQQQQQQLQLKQQPRAKQEVKAQLQEQPLLTDHKTVDLALAIERLKIEHHELQQKRHKILEQEEKEKKKQSRKGHRKHSTDGDTYYTPKESVQEEPKVLHGSAAFVCYKSRLSRMEEDMAKCKQQLFHYVQDNEQLLHEQSVRHHVEQLLHSTSSASTTSSPLAGMAQTTNELTLQATLKRDQNQLNLGHLKLERDRQKQLQLREFLARDDNNANAYELPNLSNVYKVSSRHAQLLPTTASATTTTAATQSQSTPETLPNSMVNDALKTFIDRVDSTLNNSRAQRNRQPIVASNNIYSCYFPENKSEVSAHNRVQQHQQQPYERIRIQEANFYKDFEMANFDESAHICRK